MLVVTWNALLIGSAGIPEYQHVFANKAFWKRGLGD